MSRPLASLFKVSAAQLSAVFVIAALGQSPQQPASIRVPVRLVSVPVLVASSDGRYVSGLSAGNFRLTDNGRPQAFQLDIERLPVSIAIAVQVDQDVREHLPLIAKTGNLLADSLAASNGQAALITYNDEVTTALPFQSGDGLNAAIRKIKPGGHQARMVDAGLRAVHLLAQRPVGSSRILLLIGEPVDHGSERKLDQLERAAQRENVQIYALRLPVLDKAFVHDSFGFQGLGSQWYKGGYQASVELTRVVPALHRAADASDHQDPFSVLTIATGGLQLPFRRQKQLENDIIAMGDALRSRYFLSFTPRTEANDQTFHHIGVITDVPGAKIYARPGYQMVPDE